MHEHGYGTHVLTYSLASDGSAYESSSSSALGGGRSSAHPVDFGCTAAVAVLVCQSRMLVAGNAGDSIVLLCSASDYDLGISSLSMKHAADEDDEARRLESTDGTARILDGYLQALRGPLRGHSLQPTRGLGHPLWAAYGISAEPHVSTVSISEPIDGRMGFALVVLSDGVSDLLSTEAILETVAETGCARGAARALVDEAVALANVSSGGADRDDATSAVVWWDEDDP